MKKENTNIQILATKNAHTFLVHTQCGFKRLALGWPCTADWCTEISDQFSSAQLIPAGKTILSSTSKQLDYIQMHMHRLQQL